MVQFEKYNDFVNAMKAFCGRSMEKVFFMLQRPLSGFIYTNILRKFGDGKLVVFTVA